MAALRFYSEVGAGQSALTLPQDVATVYGGLAGFGTRISEESAVRPKPMVEIGGQPILWHIMKIYASHGINDFVIC